ncbi:Protein tyrosine phosphatase type IVA 1 [Apophysomyces sp. BC1034]|nr:Protein tyrosine phosphatase type IVA 1 [Apophysomyces sp. BC1015]KAG0180002.1 Protein tyrosine phosphatase type IVA 1 [Apophysomyces sp. BC1021]KAG0193512.1 Protein tyrosine phosphatase type IVA 1 [Apophysomyces sp. BC1034]
MSYLAGKRLTAMSQSPLGRMLTIVDCLGSPLRFIILDSPTESTLDCYMGEFIHQDVSVVVRCCQPTYNAQQLVANNIDVLDLPFRDGGVPSVPIVCEWLNLIQSKRHAQTTIAVHCLAGLGRAPVLVAIALIEMGMKPLDAVAYIREKRRGAFNKVQIAYLDGYKRVLKAKPSHSFRSSLGRMFKLGWGNRWRAATAVSH